MPSLRIRWALTALSLGVWGCVATIPDDRFACTADEECPAGFRCRAGFCRTGPDDGLDAGGPEDGGGADAGPRDAGGGDAGSGDAGGGDACVPEGCQAGECGSRLDGCGATLSCGECPVGETCGGGGTPNVCGVGTCEPRTCESIGVACGPANDGCGDVRDCGSCASGERCVAGTCQPCGAPLAPRTCTGAADCDPTEACVAGHCLATCGDEASLRTAVGNLRNGAVAIAHLCVDAFATTAAFPVERDGCPGWDAVSVIPTSPTSTDHQFIVTRFPVSTQYGAAPQSYLPPIDVSVSSASIQPFSTRRIDVSPDGTHAVFGYSLNDAAANGELFRIRLSDGSVQRSAAAGVSDVAWIDDQRILAIARIGPPTPVLYWLRSAASGFVDPTPLVSDFGGRGLGFELLTAQQTVLLGGLPGSAPGDSWPEGGGNWIAFGVPRSSVLDGANQPVRTTALPAYSTDQVRRFPFVTPQQQVGPWLIGQSASGGALEMSRLSGSSPETLAIASPVGLHIGALFFTPLGDRHVLIPSSPRLLLVRLPD